MSDQHNCYYGWVCERHPNLEWEHVEPTCGAPGMLCEQCGERGLSDEMFEVVVWKKSDDASTPDCFEISLGLHNN